MSGRSPICEADLLQALSASLEPCFPASRVAEADNVTTAFLLRRGLLAKGYGTSVICDRCQERCELPVEAEEGRRFCVCPTGYVERPIPVSEDEVAVRRFDFSAFCAAFAKENRLKRWGDAGDLGRAVHPLAKGRRVNQRIVVLYALALDAKDAPSILVALKSRLPCDKLVVVTPQSDPLRKERVDALADSGICLVRLGDLLSRQTLDIGLAESGDTPVPPDAYCRVVTHEGRAFLTQQQYRALLAKRQVFDLFIDAFEKRCWKRDSRGNTTQSKLTPAELQVLCAYIESGKSAKPGRFDSSIKVFETARRKADVRVGRYQWRAFTTHRTPVDREMRAYQFTPPPDFKYCLAIPMP